MYRIMLVVKESSAETETLYKFLSTINPEGKVVPYEAVTLTEVDTQVEKMLNGEYRKKDLMIVQVSDFEINANLDEMDSATEDPGTEDDTEPGENTEPTP